MVNPKQLKEGDKLIIKLGDTELSCVFDSMVTSYNGVRFDKGKNDTFMDKGGYLTNINWIQSINGVPVK